MTLKIEFVDSGRRPSCAPNPRYPNGLDLDLSAGRRPSCWTKLPKVTNVGLFLVTCDECGKTTAITTAGRSDDPRSCKIDCLPTA